MVEDASGRKKKPLSWLDERMMIRMATANAKALFSSAKATVTILTHMRTHVCWGIMSFGLISQTPSAQTHTHISPLTNSRSFTHTHVLAHTHTHTDARERAHITHTRKHPDIPVSLSIPSANPTPPPSHTPSSPFFSFLLIISVIICLSIYFISHYFFNQTYGIRKVAQAVACF